MFNFSSLKKIKHLYEISQVTFCFNLMMKALVSNVQVWVLCILLHSTPKRLLFKCKPKDLYSNIITKTTVQKVNYVDILY